MIGWVTDIIQNNEVAQGLIIAAPTTALFYLARDLPRKIWSTLRRMITYSVMFKSDVDEYYYINKIVAEEIVNPSLVRKFSYDDVRLWNNATSQQEKVYRGLSVGYGSHWGSWRGTPCIITRELEEDNMTNAFKETLKLQFFSFSPHRVKEFVEYAQCEVKDQSKNEKLTVRVNNGSYWVRTTKVSKRPLSSVFTKGDQGRLLLEHIMDFQKQEPLIKAKGIPWRTGILLTGVPGTGKTSLIHALASASDRDIAILNLSALESDGDLVELMSQNLDWERTILVLEDIDATSAATDRNEKGANVSLSTLLNLLDGITTPEGMVTIATTNHPESLDPALMRDGRFDEVVKLERLGWSEFISMVRLLRPDEVDQFMLLEDDFVSTTGATLRKWLLKESFNSVRDKFLS